MHVSSSDKLAASNLTIEEKVLLRDLLKNEGDYYDVLSQVYRCPDVPIDEFIDNPNYLGKGDEIWPKIKEDLWRIYNDGYKQVILVEGIGCGKSTKTALVMCYEIFKLGRLVNPQRYYNLRTKSKIATINMSVRGDQAKDVIFDDVMMFVSESPWFQKYLPPDPRIKSRLKFPNNTFVLPGSSKVTAPIGYTLKAAALDEAAWFIDASHKGDSADQAENIYKTLLKRLKSRFNDYLLVICTSPRIIDDYTEKLKETAFDNNEMLWLKRSLWQAKPKGSYVGQYFVYDEKYNRVVATDIRDVIKEGFGFVPDGFELLRIEEIQYLLNLLMEFKPEIVRSNVIDETLEAREPKNIEIGRINVRDDWKLGAPEGVSDRKLDGGDDLLESDMDIDEVPIIDIY